MYSLLILDDTNFLHEKYSALVYPDTEINAVRMEAHCLTHCAAESSCAAYSYEESTSTCYLSSQARVILDDEPMRKVRVKKVFSSRLRVDYPGSSPISTAPLIAVTSTSAAQTTTSTAAQTTTSTQPASTTTTETFTTTG